MYRRGANWRSIQRVGRGHLTQAEPHLALNFSSPPKPAPKPRCFELLGILGDDLRADLGLGCFLGAGISVYDKPAPQRAAFRGGGHGAERPHLNLTTPRSPSAPIRMKAIPTITCTIMEARIAFGPIYHFAQGQRPKTHRFQLSLCSAMRRLKTIRAMPATIDTSGTRVLTH
jgi:hypothetical protein